MKKHPLLILLAAAFLFTSCASSGSTTGETIDASLITVNDEHNYDIDVTDEVTTDDSDNELDEVVIEEEVVEEPSEYDSFENGTITTSGKYYLKGDYSSINITASKGSELYIYLDGVNISSNEGIAFGSSKQITLHLVLINDSVNYISNNYVDTNAFHIKGNVLISGSGTLNIASSQKNGLKVSKDLYVYEGVTLNVTGYNHAIAARSLTANGAVISVTSQTKDGIQLECDSDVTEYTSEQGFAYLVDTRVTADTYGDGIQADTYVYISGGEYNITTHGEFVSYSSNNMSEYGLTSDDFKYVKSGNYYKRVATDEIRSLNSSYYALKNSVKGIKAGAIELDTDNDDVDDTTVTSGDYKIYIAHLAKLNINSTDDCIHTNYGSVTIDSANLTLYTYDDGAHADYDLLVNNSSISITKSYEGLEGANVTVDGVNTNIVSVSEDDGINAASDLVSTNNIYINNGYLRVYASGDGLDANTALHINGGTIIVEGPGSGNGSLDADQIYFNGGIVLACSTSGMTERMSAIQNTFVYQGSTIAAGTKVSIIDANNNALLSYTLKQSCNQIIFSHPDMTTGQTYRILSGSTVVASISMTSSLVASGTSSGGQGGMPGGNPGGNPGGGSGWR